MAKEPQMDSFELAYLAVGGLTIANLQEIKQLHRQEVAVLESVSGQLHSIQDEMNNLRKASEEGLAVQQALLNRDNVQAMLEEFIFQL
jgi:thiamine monophosphate synthase